jgi:hypothetical protein
MAKTRIKQGDTMRLNEAPVPVSPQLYATHEAQDNGPLECKCDCSQVYLHAGLVVIGLAIVILYFVDRKFNPFR